MTQPIFRTIAFEFEDVAVRWLRTVFRYPIINHKHIFAMGKSSLNEVSYTVKHKLNFITIKTLSINSPIVMPVI